MKMIFILLVLLSPPLSFAKKANEVKVPKPPEGLAAVLEDHRRNVAAGLDAEQQLPLFDPALRAFCDSFLSKDATAKNPPADYLEQMLLLAERLLEVDAGKNAMDCLGVYYEKRRKVIDVQMKKLNPEIRESLRRQLQTAHDAVTRPQ